MRGEVVTPTASLILVGTELVHGSVVDENRQFIAHELRSVGIDLISVHIVKDDVPTLAALIRHLAPVVTYLITVGGLGPTVDDVTLEAVAIALDRRPVYNEPTDVAAFAQMSGSETPQPLLRVIPEDAETILTSQGPVVRTENVFSLPGLPRLVRARWPAAVSRFEHGAICSRALTLPRAQSQVAGTLREASRIFPAVSIGCYPTSDARETTLTFVGDTAEAVEACVDYVRTEVDVERIVSG